MPPVATKLMQSPWFLNSGCGAAFRLSSVPKFELATSGRRVGGSAIRTRSARCVASSGSSVSAHWSSLPALRRPLWQRRRQQRSDRVPSMAQRRDLAQCAVQINPDGTGVRRIVPRLRRGNDDQPDWSPDARLLAFSRFPDDGPAWINVVNSDGTGLRRVTPRCAANRPPIACRAAAKTRPTSHSHRTANTSCSHARRDASASSHAMSGTRSSTPPWRPSQSTARTNARSCGSGATQATSSSRRCLPTGASSCSSATTRRCASHAWAKPSSL